MQKVNRLINKFIPEKYDLSIYPDRKNRTFSGIVTIYGISRPNTKDISLHSKDLNIKSIVIDGKKAKYTFCENDELIIHHSDISEGEHIIVVDFEGKITDSMHGLYPCYYKHNGIKKELLATQFESHHAREVFPCIDEPEAKSIFDLTLTTEKNVTVIGNMSVKNQHINKDKLVTTFESTPIMSSYLLAWVIGELQKKTERSKNGVEINIWATLAQSSKSLDFALDIATESIDFFSDYFKTPYPLKKCDHVALPDFSSGAMENWGLITYREIALLADPDLASISTKHYIATVIAHELSHQWFGNLVTMKWWDNLWLNESFATLAEYIAINKLKPDWNKWFDFMSYESMIALRRDSIDGVQSIKTKIIHPDEINTLFDGAIVYAKGARLLKMLFHYIGEEAFRSGLQEYFNIYAYKNTESQDLWSVFSKSSGKDIASFMDTWIKQPGFPVLSVKKNNNVLKLSQKRMISNFGRSSSKMWPIVLSSNYSKLPAIFDKRSNNYIIDSTKEQIPRFNIGNNAHYITNYDDKILEQLINQQKEGILSPTDRLQFLNEQAMLANAGFINNAKLIKLVSVFKEEKIEAIWNIIGLIISDLKKFVEDNDKAEDKLRILAGMTANAQFQRLGFYRKQDEPESDTKLRVKIIDLMLYSKDKIVIDTILNMFDSSSIENLDSELRGSILSTVVRYRNDTKIINTLIKIYKNTNSCDLEQDITIALTSSQNINTIKKIIGLLNDNSNIRVQDNIRWVTYFMRNKHARVQTWEWVRNNWDWIEQSFSGDKSYNDYPRHIANILSTKKQLREYCDFFGPMTSNPALSRIVKIGINEIENRVKLIERDSDSVINELLDLKIIINNRRIVMKRNNR